MSNDRRSFPTRREWLTGAAALAVGLEATPGWTLPEPRSPGALALDKGLLYGAALDVAWMSDARLVAALGANCTLIGVANGFNWTRLQPTPGVPLDFSEAETIYAFARHRGLLARGHNIIWNDEVLPRWLRATGASLSAAQTGDLLTGHVGAVMTHWRGRLLQQDVVNEPISTDAADGGRRDTLWQRTLGDRYIDLAFAAAKDADPGCLRILNQNLIEMDSPLHETCRTNLLRLIEAALKRGAPIQALGIEGHLEAAYPFSERVWRRFLDEVTGMGLALMVTEYDVLDRGIAGDVAHRDAGTAALMRDFLDVTLSYPQCIGLVSQSYCDRYDWLRRTPDKQRADGQPIRADPIDEQYARKPLWAAIRAAIAAAPVRPRQWRQA